MRIIIFTSGLLGKTGLYTWTRNFAINMRQDYTITIMCATFNEDIKADLMQFADCVVYEKDATYDCDILLHNFQDNAVKGNIHADKVFVLLHCNYAKMRHSNTFERDIKYIAVSEDTARGMRNVYGVDCEAIEPFKIGYKPKPVLKLVSATRMTVEKGYNRMVKLCKLLRENGIRFIWLVFTDSFKPIEGFPEFINMGSQPNEVVRDYMANADYTVQLSDHEGYCYSVHESLSAGTPCLVTDIPIFRNAIANDYNGYLLPLDMQNINISEIVNYIPLGYEMNGKSTDDLKKQWERVLNG